jgi:hypothetical protein
MLVEAVVALNLALAELAALAAAVTELMVVRKAKMA